MEERVVERVAVEFAMVGGALRLGCFFLPVLPSADKKPRWAELKRPPLRLAELASALGPILDEDAAPRMDKWVSMGQLNRDWREAGDSLVSKRLRGAMLGLALGRKEGENLVGDGGVRFRRFIVAAWNDIQQLQWCVGCQQTNCAWCASK